MDHDADFVFLTETWLTSNFGYIKSYYQSINYNLLHKPRDNQRGGGVAILSLNTYTINKIFLGTYESFEYCSYLLNHMSGLKIIFISLYRPPRDNLSEFFLQFTTILENISTMRTEIFIAGDINIHLEKNSINSNKFVDLIKNFNLTQHISFPTHRHGHTIDFVITSNDLNVNGLCADNVILSDHFLLSLNISIPKHNPVYKTIFYRNFKNFDHHNFDLELSDSLKLNNFDNTNFKSSIEFYDATCSSALEKFAPLKSKIIKVVSHSPWFDHEYNCLRRLRRKAEKRFKKTNLAIDKERFVSLRKQTTTLARRKKISYFSTKINDTNNNNTKQLFSVVNNLLGKNNELIYPSASSTNELCRNFANFFTDKIKDIRNSFSINPNNFIETKDTLTENNLIPTLNFFNETSVDEIRTIIKESGFSSSPNDPLPPFILKHEFELFLPIWCLLINKSLSSGNFDGLKESIIGPLIKDSSLDPEILKNYRPVSNLPFLEKLTERIVLKRLNIYMSANNFHIPNQFGYKKSHSTEALLIRVVNDILVATDKNSATVLLLLDLSAAFDTVDHNKLLHILRNELGICGNAFKWLKSYITFRFSRVKIGNDYSESLLVEFGVPQGSVLGPILFNIYLRSLYKQISGINFFVEGFADDHQIFRHFIPVFQKKVLIDEIDGCFKLVQHWMDEYFLKLNPDKTHIILFSPSKYLQNRLLINGTFINDKKTCIRFVNSAKNLGVIFDKYLNFEPHLAKLISSCFLTIKNLSKIKAYLSLEHLKILVCSLILSKLDYCNSLLYGIKSYQLRKLQSVQNAAAKLIFGRRKFDHVSDLFEKLHWLRIDQRITFKILILVHNSVYLESFPTPTKTLISILNHRSMILSIPHLTTSIGRRAFSFIGPKMWNTLPTILRQNTELLSFKKSLKTYLFSNYFEFTSHLNT